MSTTSDPSGLITKTTVILDKPTDWADWLMLRRDKAEQNDIWEHCDPSKPPKDLGPQPTRPRLTDYKENATRLSQLEKQEQEDYRDALETFAYDSPQWDKKNRALKALASEILATVAKRLLYLLKDRTTAYDRLTTLKQHLCPSDRTCERELQTKYRDLLKSPRGRGIEKWLEEWITITDQCSDLNMAEVAGLRAQEEFFIAVKPIQGSWATNQLDKLYDAHEDGGKLPTVRQLVASFRNFHRRINPVASSLGTFGASLQAAQPAGEQQDRPQPPNNRKKQPKCLCGDIHWYSDCVTILSILAPERVSKGFRPDPTKEEKVRDAFRDQEKKQKVQNIVFKRSQPNTGKRELRTDTIASSASAPFSMDDGQAVAGIPHTYALQAVALSAAAKKDLLVPHLMNRWILDPGSNIHVCNTKRFGWKKFRDATNGEIVFAGGQAMQIQEWGEVVLEAKGASGALPVRLTMVAYVEGFFANILGLSRCRSQNIHFDSGRDLLYIKTPQHVFCHLEFHNGHWLIDANPSSRPELDSLAVMATRFRPSTNPRSALKLTAPDAHRLWGHPGADAVKHLPGNVVGVAVVGHDPAPTWTNCRICVETKMHQLISRRPSSDPATRPFYRIGIDLVQLCPRGTDCYNGDKYGLHAVCEYTEWHEATTLATRAHMCLCPHSKLLSCGYSASSTTGLSFFASTTTPGTATTYTTPAAQPESR
ncbi:reverse transcriptase domain protein [Paraphaeosphaeria sporulosa]